MEVQLAVQLKQMLWIHRTNATKPRRGIMQKAQLQHFKLNEKQHCVFQSHIGNK